MNYRITDYQDYKNISEAIQAETVEIDETICQACGSLLESRIENLGFDDNPFYEVEHFCPRGCEQNEKVIIL